MPEDLFKRRSELLSAVLRHVGTVHGRTRLQKMIFLAQKELGVEPLFDFQKHYYGPYSGDLTETLERMISRGDIVEEIEEVGDAIRYSYSLSEDADKFIKPIESFGLSPDSHDTLRKLSQISLTALLSYVYQKYLPERCAAQ